jgi:alkanesulfonate monooxygenase SsuD/methylene tetrahydromethanopterin reductase-like flavin-dependent oxidoreductase (luciferase family)
MRIGLGFIGLWIPPREIVRLGCEAEARGFDSVWLAEDTWFTGRDAVSVLGALAWATERITLGTAILPVHHNRHLLLLAATVASLDDLARGRLILGLGLGMRWPSYPADAKPLMLMREAVEGLRGLLTGAAVEHRGRMLRLQLPEGPVCWEPVPPLRSRIPIYIAARGPKMTQLACRLGDGLVLPLHTPPAVIRERREVLDTEAQAHGRQAEELDLVANLHLCVTADGTIPDRLRAQVAGVLCSPDLTDEVLGSAGLDCERVAAIRARVAAQGREAAAALVTPRMVDEFCVAGSPERCVDLLARYEAAGLKRAVLYPLGGQPELALDLASAYTGL